MASFKAPKLLSTALSPDGKQAVLGSTIVRLIDVASGQERELESSKSSFGDHVALTTDGKILAATVDRYLVLYDPQTGQEIRRWLHNQVSPAICFSPDGKLLASAGYQTVRLWDVASGNEIHVLKGHEDTVSAVAFSPDGQRLVSSNAAPRGLDRGGIKVWEVGTGKELASIPYAARVMAVTFAPDGRRVFAAMGGMVGIWELTGPDGNK